MTNLQISTVEKIFKADNVLRTYKFSIQFEKNPSQTAIWELEKRIDELFIKLASLGEIPTEVKKLKEYSRFLQEQEEEAATQENLAWERLEMQEWAEYNSDQ